MSSHSGSKVKPDFLAPMSRPPKNPRSQTLGREAKAWNRRMNRDRVKIAWKLDRKAARRKFGYKRNCFKRS